MSEIRVWVVGGKRKFYLLKWRDPRTGKRHEQQTDIPCRPSLRAVAQERARRKELELEIPPPPERILWRDFVDRYLHEKLAGCSDPYRKHWLVVVKHINTTIKPVWLEDVNRSSISQMLGQLRKRKARETSLSSYVSTLKAALNWAYDLELLEDRIRMPKLTGARGVSKHARGRPISTEEFERMLEACRRLRPRDAQLYVDFLEALWWSGLRIGEAYRLSWDLRDGFAIVLDGQWSHYRIRADSEKGHRDRTEPVAPEFVQWLEARGGAGKGRVLPIPWAQSTVEKRISDFGRAAHIQVDPTTGKTASAHDLRRSFATRWSQRLLPQQLQAIMRHASVTTTEDYYVEQDWRALSRELWRHSCGQPCGQTQSGTLDADSSLAKDRS